MEQATFYIPSFESAWRDLSNCHEQFRPQLVQKLKTELILKLDSFSMPKIRKDYLLHQLAYVREATQLEDLIFTINAKQVQDGPQNEVLYPVITASTIGWQSIYPTEPLH
jgi:hypothetical protein